MQPGLAGAERVFEFLDTPVEIRDRPGARVLKNPTGAIAFRDVAFEYRAGEPVLQDITVEIPAGSVVALVGPSGAGKTTLADFSGGSTT